ncbi:uncharacterized protein LOC134203439 [Armigeres subalbatus]|uniref:uncharacterized protein LOC134203439 n=1 Tax=Armigeres subalbatus TaxID=124917 RepID=UPI002ED380AA
MNIFNRKTAVPVLRFRNFLLLSQNSSKKQMDSGKRISCCSIPPRTLGAQINTLGSNENFQPEYFQYEPGPQHVTLNKIKINQQNSLLSDIPPAAVAPHHARHLYCFCLEFYVATHRFLEHHQRWSCNGPPVIGKYL